MSRLSVRELTVRDRDGATLLDSVSLAVEADETVLLAGPSGSGKSLLALAAAGLIETRPGLSRDGSVERSGPVGVLLQDPRSQLVRETVYSDVAFGLENEGLAVDRIHERIDRWAGSLEATHLLDRRVDSLSRGETTLAALLGVLVTEPELLILDEPLSSLDAPSRGAILKRLDTLESVGLLVTEHDAVGLLERVDRVALLASGRIETRGTPRAVLPALKAFGVRLPFGTEFALRRDEPGNRIPLGTGQ